MNESKLPAQTSLRILKEVKFLIFEGTETISYLKPRPS